MSTRTNLAGPARCSGLGDDGIVDLPMKGYGIFELYRRQAEALAAQRNLYIKNPRRGGATGRSYSPAPSRL